MNAATETAKNWTVLIDKMPRKVLNTLSCGPGCAAHTYELAGGDYVYTHSGAIWYLQTPGQSPREVCFQFCM